MARVKRAVAGRKKRNTLAERSKGYYGVRSRTFRGMKEQVQHSLALVNCARLLLPPSR